MFERTGRRDSSPRSPPNPPREAAHLALEAGEWLLPRQRSGHPVDGVLQYPAKPRVVLRGGDEQAVVGQEKLLEPLGRFGKAGQLDVLVVQRQRIVVEREVRDRRPAAVVPRAATATSCLLKLPARREPAEARTRTMTSLLVSMCRRDEPR